MTIATKTAGRDDVRAGILNASLALMNEGGLGALSMREVARRAGVSHQAPYHYSTTARRSWPNWLARASTSCTTTWSAPSGTLATGAAAPGDR